MTNDLKDYVAKETIKSCMKHLKILDKRILNGNNYLSSNYDNLTERRYLYLKSELDNLKKLKIWLIKYIKHIKTKYSYYV